MIIISIIYLIQLDPKTVWLRQEVGRRCFFPDTAGRFKIDRATTGILYGLVVEGTPLAVASLQQASPTSVQESSNNPVVAVASNDAGPSHQGQGTPITPFFKSTKKNTEGTFNVKVVKAKFTKLPSGKLELSDRLEQLNITLEDSVANVHVVTSAIRKKWGSAYVVVTGDGLEVDDSAGTQGT